MSAPWTRPGIVRSPRGHILPVLTYDAAGVEGSREQQMIRTIVNRRPLSARNRKDAVSPGSPSPASFIPTYLAGTPCYPVRSPLRAGREEAATDCYTPLRSRPQSARPVRARPMSASPVNARPMSARPMSARPMSARPVSGRLSFESPPTKPSGQRQTAPFPMLLPGKADWIGKAFNVHGAHLRPDNFAQEQEEAALKPKWNAYTCKSPPCTREACMEKLYPISLM